ncbi:InlB B-repeat-containing protein [Aquimarina sp. 2201CG14-23]|uniref:InlB B-repeat-containing protein n=1 Tax=Aquimarina mycalae TaxID=3040073 RepID=UPI00247825F0|nr:fibronectin type III domain-containing protein [Aquimarina sp. 2201CG14-23]MDH7447125.1 fibronectin type III domain-containing protein [Aquimarina sp. 2201CG14-23]
MKKLLILFVFLLGMQTQASNDKYRLSLRGNPATSIVIGWDQTSGSNPIVHYGTTDYGTNYSSYPDSKSPDRTVSYKGMNNTFARLTGLQPNTAYYFVIRDNQGTSERFWFKTAPADKSRLSFIAGGDSRNNRTPRQNANRLVAKLKPHAVLFGGDMTDSDSSSQWQTWFNDWQLTIASDGRMFPIVAARGNHEDSNNSIYHLFDVPSSSVYYAITFGDNLIRTYTLNTEISISGNQTTWLQNDLNANANATWKIAQYHKPMRPHVSYKSEGNSQYSNWSQLFYDKGVKLVIECDAHTVKTTWPVRPTTGSGSDEGFIRDDQNGTVYAGEGCWGAPLRSNDDNKDWTRNSARFNQFKWIFVDEDKIETRTIKVDNASQVGSVSNNNVFQIPSNLDIWNPSNGSVVTINKGTTVDPDPDNGSIEVAIATGNDDVEERQNGDLYTNSSDLELVYDAHSSGGYQVIGLRFRSLALPKNVTITSAYLQFTADESNSANAELEISLHNSSNSPAFSSSNNVSSRNTFANKVTWNPQSWSSGQNGNGQRSPDLKSMVQSLVNKSDWASGNNASFVIRGKGVSLTSTSAKRVADSYEGGASKAPKLIVNYETSSTNNYTLSINTTGQGIVDGAGTYQEGETATINAIPSNGWEFSGWSGALAGSTNPTSITMDGNKVITAVFTEITGGGDSGSIDVAITAGSDDVEERQNGDLYTNSSDLELVYDSHSNAGYQVIGLHFRSLGLPKDATITSAYLQFTADESHNANAELEIALHNSGNSPAFSNSNKVSNRNTFSSKVTWNPQSWSSGQNGNAQRSPDLKNMIQSLVNKDDWVLGNNASFVIRGKGVSLTSTSAKRVADSYEGGSNKAARLIVNYTSDESNVPIDICSGISAWQSNTNYDVGDKVTYSGYLYERTSSNWINLGACGALRSSENAAQFPPIEEISKDFVFNIYPNPFKDEVTITTPFLKHPDEKYKVMIYNLEGKILYSKSIQPTSSDGAILIAPKINKSGIYLLSISDKNGKTIQTTRLIRH